MASYLGEYPGCATRREEKFCRAVNSFLNQTYAHVAELVIVADGCTKTLELYHIHYRKHQNIRVIDIPKQELFSGHIRNVGIEYAQGGIICYLDTDDYFGEHHLQKVYHGFEEDLDWIYWDYWVKHPEGAKPRRVIPEKASIGTSAIAHRRPINHKWPNGWGHDWSFVVGLKQKYRNYKSIGQADYFVCHIKDCIDT